MACSERNKSTQVNRYWKKSRKVNAPIILEDLIVKEILSSLEDGDIHKLSVITYPTNEDSILIKRKIRILDHLNNLIEVLREMLTIAPGLTGENITMGPNQYCFTQTFIDWEALHIFYLKSAELRHKTIANLIIVMNHVVTYFDQKVCVSKQKRHVRYKMEKLQACHKAICGIGLLSKFKDGTGATHV